MIEIINKKSRELIAVGKVEFENENEIKLLNSQIIFKKSKVIGRYIILNIIIMLCLSSCEIQRNLTESEKLKMRKLDSLIKENQKLLEMEFRENRW